MLAVEDTGIGIPAYHPPHIFERFFRVPNAEVRAERGLGLGLSYVAWIVKVRLQFRRGRVYSWNTG